MSLNLASDKILILHELNKLIVYHKMKFYLGGV